MRTSVGGVEDRAMDLEAQARLSKAVMLERELLLCGGGGFQAEG